MKTIFGIAIIAFGIFLEITWLGICFGTVIIGVLLLIFAPGILFFPFNFFLVIGLSIIKGTPYTRSTNFRYKQYSNFSNQSNFSGQSGYSNHQNTYVQEDKIDKYYKILESSKDDSFAVIKTRYRKLMKEYHYDSIASKDLPQEMIDYAEEKTKDLNEAYSVIKKIKG